MQKIAIITAIAVALFATDVFAGEVLDRVKQTGTLRVATVANWAPQSFLNDNNELDGFDVDVAKKIAFRLGVEPQFITWEWNGVATDSHGSPWDVSVGPRSPTTERSRALDYWYAPAGFAVHMDSAAKTLADLNDKRIGVCSSCTYQYYLEKDPNLFGEYVWQHTIDGTNVVPARIVSVKDPHTIYKDLLQGDGVLLDGMIHSLPAIRAVIEEGYPIRVLGEPVFYEPLSVATSESDSEFDQVLSEIVKSMYTEGVILQLSEKWYGPKSWPELSANHTFLYPPPVSVSSTGPGTANSYVGFIASEGSGIGEKVKYLPVSGASCRNNSVQQESVTKDSVEKRMEDDPAGFWKEATCREAEVATRIFLDNGDDNKDTPLHWASRYSERGVVDLLLNILKDENVTADAKGEYNLTPLHYAAANNTREVVELLLKYGAKPNAWSLFGRPLELARIYNDENPEVQQALSEHGAVD